MASFRNPLYRTTKFIRESEGDDLVDELLAAVEEAEAALND